MRLFFKFFLYFFIIEKVYTIPFYPYTIKKEERFYYSGIYWEFIFPFDFQYRIFKEGNHWNLEGMNIGVPKFFIRTSIIENKKNISLLEFEKKFFRCEHIKSSILNIKNQFLKKNYRICNKKSFVEFKIYQYSNKIFYILYIAIFDINSDQQLWESFINSIQWKPKIAQE